LTDLSLVPDWLPLNRYFEIGDWIENRRKSAGVVRLIHSLHAQLRSLSLLGFVKHDVMNNLNFHLLNRLHQFTLKPAFHPESCDGEPEEFSEIHLQFIKKALKSKA